MPSLPLYKQIQNDIKKMYAEGKLREGDRIPSEKELADQYNVSQITSKNALIGLMEEGIVVRIKGKGTFVKGDSSQQKILAYYSSQQAQGRGTIGLIVPMLKNRVEQQFVNGIEYYSNEAGYDIMLRITRESQEEEAKAIEAFLQKGVQGMIIFPVEQENYNESILRLSLEKKPLVLLDRFLKEIRTYSVSSDNVNGTCVAVDELLKDGHQTIAFITPENTNSATDERAQGFEKAFQQRGIPIDKNLWCVIPLRTLYSEEAYGQIFEFLQQNPEITAVFTVNTMLAQFTYKAAKQLGRAVPDHIKLVTFDSPELDHVSWIQQNEQEMCRQTLNLLLEQMQGAYEPRRVVVPVNLIKGIHSSSE
ncbi:GntR family transcriptional regulator [Paenibacillus allorhizosphaerae]|uniref:Arabinose metabolism transcriptional repressor n=1 Tax=Paenibacillus allorhizosphaerae TaxID=2849866 RepID=A0ABM8VPC1_9BACL|nr:GntR family transcriptional regulator [Paenibacillus allorhizosphaerae]CAG7652675.1 Arabinose metabolism transcriptional repressor [Paenibacillus allorhizosphaerae]